MAEAALHLILVGDLDDTDSHVAHMVGREPVAVRRPEKETRPKLFYRGAHQATLDPLAARRPEGGIFMWSQQLEGPHHVVAGNPEAGNSSAAAVLAYDVAHKAPWDWRVSLYTLTKGIAAGAYLVPLLLLLLGAIGDTSPLWQWAAPIAAGADLAEAGTSDGDAIPTRDVFLAADVFFEVDLWGKLRRANESSGEARAELLAAAERLFLSIREEAEGVPAYHLGLGQVYHRLGRADHAGARARGRH